jgi:hypothetical protein
VRINPEIEIGNHVAASTTENNFAGRSSWFDKFTMRRFNILLILSLSKDEERFPGR